MTLVAMMLRCSCEMLLAEVASDAVLVVGSSGGWLVCNSMSSVLVHPASSVYDSRPRGLRMAAPWCRPCTLLCTLQ